MIQLRGVSKAFGGLRVLESIDLEIKQGEILGLIGPNGAGKTTLFNLISGQIFLDQGSIQFFGSGQRIESWSAQRRAWELKIGRTFQVVKPFLNMTCEENIQIGQLNRSISETKAPTNKTVEELLLRFGLQDFRDRNASELTLMQKKKLELARVLAFDPVVILLDEFMSGLNPTEVNEALGLFRWLNRDLGITIFWIEHLIHAIEKGADRVIVLHQGKTLCEGTPAEVLKNPSVIEAYLGRRE